MLPLQSDPLYTIKMIEAVYSGSFLLQSEWYRAKFLPRKMVPFWHWTFLFATSNASDSWVWLCIVHSRKYMIFWKEGGTERVCFCFLRIRRDNFYFWSDQLWWARNQALHTCDSPASRKCLKSIRLSVQCLKTVSYDKSSIWWGSGFLFLSIKHWHSCCM